MPQKRLLKWKLTANLYAGLSIQSVRRDCVKVKKRAISFRKNYCRKIAKLTLLELAAALTEYAQIRELLAKPLAYARMAFSTKSHLKAAVRLYSYSLETENIVLQELVFFEIELSQLPEQTQPTLGKSTVLAPYGHYIYRMYAQRHHKLSDQEEILIISKKLSGTKAFATLFDELRASFRYRVHGDDAQGVVTGDDLLGLQFHQNAATREEALTQFFTPYKEHGLVFRSIINAITQDHITESRQRRHSDPMASAHLAKQLHPDTVRQLLDTTEEYYPLARTYYELKTQLLKIGQLKNSDIQAPVGSPHKKFPYAEAQQILLHAFEAFHPIFKETAHHFFTSNRIDLFPRPGKIPGAFCVGISPSAPPHIFLNYTSNLRSVTTLAHELGHGIQYTLAKMQNMLDYHPALPLAETAAVFAEHLVIRSLMEQTQDIAERISILCFTIESIITTTFRQNVLTRFEEKLYATRARMLLDEKAICELWWQENEKLYGTAVTMVGAYKWGWSTIPHFIHSPFYCYSYIFAQLTTLVLHEVYRKSEASFPEMFITLLETGGKIPPDAALTKLNINVNKTGFWHEGYILLDNMIDELAMLSKKANYF